MKRWEAEPGVQPFERVCCERPLGPTALPLVPALVAAAPEGEPARRAG